MKYRKGLRKTKIKRLRKKTVSRRTKVKRLRNKAVLRKTKVKRLRKKTVLRRTKVKRLRKKNVLQRKRKLLRRKRKLKLQKIRRKKVQIETTPIETPIETLVETNEPSLMKGVNLIGFTRAETGLGESCRGMANSLHATNIPFGIMDFLSHHYTEANDLTWAFKEMATASHNVNISHLNADTLPLAYQHFGEGVFKHRYNIGYWHWELPNFPDEYVESFRLLQEVWVPSQFVLDAVSKKSTVPVVRIPHSIEVKCPEWFDRDYFGLEKTRFLFLCMFDARSITERKNPEAVIEAFKLAFAENDTSVGLVIKVNFLSMETLVSLMQRIEGFNNIRLITRVLTRNEVNSLVNSVDCYLSLHRSEGFGMILAEAMYLGKPVIGTGWSGNTDFMNTVNSCPVNYTLAPIGRDLGPYKANQIWAEPDIHHAAYYMRRLVNESDWRNEVSFNGQTTILTHYSPLVVGEMIKQRLASLELL